MTKYEVVPKHRLNKYGGVYTSEIRDDRRKQQRLKLKKKKQQQKLQASASSNIGRACVQPNPNKSNEINQKKIYENLFAPNLASTYKN